MRIRNSRDVGRTVRPPPLIPSSPGGALEHEEEDEDEDLTQYDEPLAARIKDINPQLSSPFFNGRLPTEIRTLIFAFAVTETRGKRYPKDTHYTRPGFQHHLTIPTALLLTCRRVYLETHHLPFLARTHVFWHGRAPEPCPYNDEQSYFLRFPRYMVAQAREVHLFTQQWWLESTLLPTCKLEVLQGIEKLTITLRRGDWWNWENAQQLAINPQRGNADLMLMKADWALEARGQPITWAEGAWGSAFRHLRSLKELVMEFETSEAEEKQLEEIVAHARLWRFPMQGGPGAANRLLSAEGHDVVKRQWHGPEILWGRACRFHSERRPQGTLEPLTSEYQMPEPQRLECAACAERATATRKCDKPTLSSFKVTWNLVTSVVTS